MSTTNRNALSDFHSLHTHRVQGRDYSPARGCCWHSLLRGVFHCSPSPAASAVPPAAAAPCSDTCRSAGTSPPCPPHLSHPLPPPAPPRLPATTNLSDVRWTRSRYKYQGDRALLGSPPASKVILACLETPFFSQVVRTSRMKSAGFSCGAQGNPGEGGGVRDREEVHIIPRLSK